ncbi:unnamed protein product [Knipowitschia caucasica]|uniref:DnaJ homolog subfamily B member 9 n=1 Tax=Knipowitschia caucasica TaxID=637954 RepID=A0AAV2M5J2_KNICA
MYVCVVLALLGLAAVWPPAAPVSAAGDFYEALDLPRTATHAQIKRAFRSLALKHHPDKDRSKEAEARFREIAEAYKVLSSSEDRRRYDLMGHEDFVKSSSGVDDEPTHFYDAFHFFEQDFFGEDFSEEDREFTWSFTEDHTFHSPTFSFVFSDGDEYEEDYSF